MAGLTFQFETPAAAMQFHATNNGYSAAIGWLNCDLHNYLKTTVASSFSASVKAVQKSISKYTYNSGATPPSVSTEESVFIPSVHEVYENQGVWPNRFSDNADKLGLNGTFERYLGYRLVIPAYAKGSWLRDTSTSWGVARIEAKGSLNGGQVYINLSVLPCFCF